jgi:pimeloyl-ACP methyl ester carboxylesterase
MATPSRRYSKLALSGIISFALLATSVGTTASAAKKKTTKRRTKTTIAAAPVTEAPTTTALASPTTTIAPAPVSTVLWKACYGAFECATVPAPLDYSNPNGTKISLGLQRLKATDPAKKLGSILLNPGGPGGSGIRLLEKKPEIVAASARQFYDVIGFDVRGLGDSTQLPCASAQGDLARSSKQYVIAVKDACDNRAAALRPHITTANTARDMDTIRIALGEAKLNYIGISYGTYLGLVYADLFPDKVGRFVIDSAVDPNLRAIELQIGQFTQIEANLITVLKRCVAPTCPFADADTVGRFDRLVKTVERAPVIARPYGVNGPVLMSLARILPLRKGGEALLMKMLTELERKDATAIFDVIKLLDGDLPDPSDLLEGVDSDAVYFQVACAEGFHPSTSPEFGDYVKLVTAQAPRFVALANAQTFPTCAYWDSKVDKRPIPVAKPGVPPMLFVASTNDPVTPLVWTSAVSTRWPGSVLLTVNSFEHGATPDVPCANKSVADYFLTGVLPAPNACAAA